MLYNGKKRERDFAWKREAQEAEKNRTTRKNNYRSTYNSEDMARAVAQVKKQKMSIREAALEYGVKRSTLHHIVKGNVAEQVGRPTVLDKE